MPASSVNPRPSVSFSTVPQLLEHQAKHIPDAPAILAPGRASLTYGRLYQHIDQTVRALRAMGIRRRDRVAVVLPNGPEMAVAALAVEASAVCVPVNPAYEVDELDRYLADLRPRALIAQAGIDSPARRTALARGIRVIELSSELDAEAGLFTLSGEQEIPSSDEPAGASDVAALLLTSGTTAQPKIVPLTHANICASACSSVKVLALTEADRTINILPLFHGHSLINVVLASLAAGASVVCAPGCDVNRFFAWLREFRPTWYSAVPTMHRALLAQARHNREQVAGHGLRFIRSSSASLPPDVLAQMEETFETAVIEGYGMTETASAHIACNPLPPGQRKPGSVGVQADLDVAIMDEGGVLLPRGQTGQVVVRGASVAGGYDGDPITTEAAFAGGWFKTGDLGFFDDDGYLFLAGRILERINRGGEKIAPQEVEDVLLKHPAVAEAVAFAVPHATLGEDVATAVVLRPDAAATPKDLRQFAIGRIADFKVPRHVLVVEEIPKGPTGKVQRIGLAARLGLSTSTALPPAYVAPRTPLEMTLAKRWAEILRLEQIGIHDDFFASGGDSLLATRVLNHVYDIAHVELEIWRLFEAPTVAEVARYLEQLIHAGEAPRSSAAIERAPREKGKVQVSIAQERLWKLLHAVPDVPLFNTVYALRLTSPIDATMLERSINEIVRRHEILRTTFADVDGQLVQVIAPQLTVPLVFKDLHKSAKSRKETAVHKIFQEELHHFFDLARGPLVRTRLARLAERNHLLLMNMSGIIGDGWSLGVLINELATVYDAFSAGRASPLAPLPIQYADFAHWQRRWRSYPEIAPQLTYWLEQLRHPLPVMKLATRRRRKIDVFDTARRRVALPAKLSEAAKRFSQREGVTLFMTLTTAFKVLLHQHTGEDDLRLATHVANRNRPRTEGLIGPLVNTVILRTSLAGNPSCREVMRRVRATTLAAFANQDLPFEEVASTLEHERGVEPEALAQVLVWLQNDELRPIMRADHVLSFEEVDPGAMLPLVTITAFDIMLMLRESPQGLVGTCVYKPYLGDETIDRLLREFQQVLEQMVMQRERPISEMPCR
jgi:acyl-CoA synthetase (AMP-forming)/AMP-acid ligase II